MAFPFQILLENTFNFNQKINKRRTICYVKHVRACNSHDDMMTFDMNHQRWNKNFAGEMKRYGRRCNPILADSVLARGRIRSLAVLINIHYRHGAPYTTRRLQTARTGLLRLADFPVPMLRGYGHEMLYHQE
jgi:hypothetical protein